MEGYEGWRKRATGSGLWRSAEGSRKEPPAEQRAQEVKIAAVERKANGG